MPRNWKHFKLYSWIITTNEYYWIADFRHNTTELFLFAKTVTFEIQYVVPDVGTQPIRIAHAYAFARIEGFGTRHWWWRHSHGNRDDQARIAARVATLGRRNKSGTHLLGDYLCQWFIFRTKTSSNMAAVSGAADNQLRWTEATRDRLSGSSNLGAQLSNLSL